MLENLVFLNFILFTVSITVFAIFKSKNPVYGVLSFMVVIAMVVVFLISLDAEFLGYVLAIIYIGAIVVLFLFVVMMFHIRLFENRSSNILTLFEYFTLGALISTITNIYLTTNSSFTYIDYLLISVNKSFIPISAFLLYNDLWFLTVFAGLIMLIGIIGAITISSKTTSIITTSGSEIVAIQRRDITSDVLIVKS